MAGLKADLKPLPVPPTSVRKAIQFQKPDEIYVTSGGPTALNVDVKLTLKPEFAAPGVTVVGTQIDTIEITEDRELFEQALAQIN